MMRKKFPKQRRKVRTIQREGKGHSVWVVDSGGILTLDIQRWVSH